MDIIGATVSNVDETAVPEQPPDGFQEVPGLASSSSVDYTAPKPELPPVPTGCEETPGLAWHLQEVATMQSLMCS